MTSHKIEYDLGTHGIVRRTTQHLYWSTADKRVVLRHAVAALTPDTTKRLETSTIMAVLYADSDVDRANILSAMAFKTCTVLA